MTAPTQPRSARSELAESDELRSRVEQIDWFHSYEIAPGIVSPGVYQPQIHLDRGCLPEDLTGRSVLDIGAWDGFFSFEAERRGAARVVAADSWAWQGRSKLLPKPGSSEPAFGSKRGFELVHELRDSKVESVEVEVMDLDPAVIGTFDVVLLLGVLYHLPHPLLALEKVASVVADGGMVIVETVIDQMFTRRPAAAFYPGNDLNADDSNYWGTNLACNLGMLRVAGFDRAETHWHTRFPTRVGHFAKQMVKGNRLPFVQAMNTGRGVFYGYKKAAEHS